MSRHASAPPLADATGYGPFPTTLLTGRLRITSELLTRAIPGLAGRRVHICGPTEMTDTTRQMLRGLGVPDAMIHVESFTSPSRATADPAAAPLTVADADDGGEATVTFAKSDKSASVPAGRTVLEAAEELGVSINYDCRSGICGQCKVKLLSGRVVMEAEDALTPADRANNVILSCQARCLDQVVAEA